MTLFEFMKTKDWKPGICITLDMNGQLRKLWIGNATCYHQPSNNDAGFGWDDDYLDSTVVSVKYADDDQ